MAVAASWMLLLAGCYYWILHCSNSLVGTNWWAQKMHFTFPWAFLDSVFFLETLSGKTLKEKGCCLIKIVLINLFFKWVWCSLCAEGHTVPIVEQLSQSCFSCLGVKEKESVAVAPSFSTAICPHSGAVCLAKYICRYKMQSFSQNVLGFKCVCFGLIHMTLFYF